ncbi:MAG: ribonuclease HI [Bacteroidales bacterium]|jgi:ribonuclease HI|nr:ribonuclease HI [Bacteroidales bacterium]MCI2121811.1 ribonuclease HI [Bacteroidales bacterium]MCI2144663.1 ribonuclease HI [Bacteroidales bacterium]
MRKVPIKLFTDGSSKGNPGPGGYAAILRCENLEKEIWGGFSFTTNNRMELMAVIAGLEAIKWKRADVTVYSDSVYVVNAVNKGWVFEWEKKEFEKKANIDLWIRFLSVYRMHEVKFVWVKGHAGHPENERCDKLAVAAGSVKNLPPDPNYRSGGSLLK